MMWLWDGVAWRRGSTTITGGGGGGTPSAGLFFEMPDMSSSPKKALAHLFGPYHPSFENAVSSADYYATEFLTPTGESGAHTAFGGHLRDRPMPRPVRTGDFLYQDLSVWLSTAKSAGLDGFFCDILGPPGDDQEAMYTKMRTVANTDSPGFLIVPMLDAFSVGTGPSAATIASWIAPYAGLSSTWMDGGAFVVASFYAEGYTVARWNSIAAAITSATGLAVKWVHVFVDIDQAPAYASINWASGGWGTDADANIAAIYDPMVTQAHTRGEKALAPIWSQVISPEPDHGQEWLEALNTLSLRNHWTTAITHNPDIVQLGTWSDFSEGSQFCPSPVRGQVTLDVSSYFLVRWKTGAYPTILADTIYLSYRNHPNTSAATLGPQTQFMNKRTYGGAEATTRYAVEALVFLTSAATVEITTGGTPTQFSAPVGMSSWTVTAAVGAVSGRIIRASSTVVSLACPVAIRSNVWVQDRQYFMFGSVRGTTGQFDPMFTSAGAAPTYPSAPTTGLYPAIDLYPATNLYPEGVSTGLYPATDLYPSTTLYPAI